MQLIRLLEFGLVLTAVRVVLPGAFDFAVARIDRLVHGTDRRPIGRPRPPAIDPYAGHREQALSAFREIALGEWLYVPTKLPSTPASKPSSGPSPFPD